MNPQSVVGDAGRIRRYGRLCNRIDAEGSPKRFLRDENCAVSKQVSKQVTYPHTKSSIVNSFHFIPFHSINLKSATPMHVFSTKVPLHIPLSLCSDLAKVRLDSRLERLGVRAHDLGNLLAVPEQEERRHGADAEVLGDVWNVVDVELEEARCGVGF